MKKYSSTYNRYFTGIKTAYWLVEDVDEWNNKDFPKFDVDEKEVNKRTIEHLVEKVAQWEKDGIRLENLIHEMESVIRRFEDVQKNL